MSNKAFFNLSSAAALGNGGHSLPGGVVARHATCPETLSRPPALRQSATRRRLFCTLFALSCLFAGAVPADYRSGIDALNRGDYALALGELRPLAEKGDSRAQWALGYMYRLGLGVKKDPKRAQQWRDRAVHGLLGQAKPRGGERVQPPARGVGPARPAPPSPRHLAGSATGILVDSHGHVLTNAHVAAGCKAIQVRTDAVTARATPASSDRAADLALLTLASPIAAEAATFRAKPRAVLGEQVMIAGFPLQGLLSDGLQVGVGIVSALAGPRGDHRLIQIDASVLPGNSGGPVLDTRGQVIGVVAGVLRPEEASQAGAPWPPDIGFAVRGEVVAAFLNRAGVRYRTSTRARADSATLAEQAGRFTVRVECLR